MAATSPEAIQRERERAKRWKELNRDEMNARRRERRRANPEAERTRRRIEKLKLYYGIEPAEYDAMLQRQGGVCAICGTDKHGGNRKSNHFQIDHCHSTGKIRGLLCAKCNRGLGLLGDTVEALEKVLVYLKKECNE